MNRYQLSLVICQLVLIGLNAFLSCLFIILYHDNPLIRYVHFNEIIFNWLHEIEIQNPKGTTRHSVPYHKMLNSSLGWDSNPQLGIFPFNSHDVNINSVKI